MRKLNLQFFAKDRVLGSAAKVELYTPNGLMTIEVDSFSKSQKHTTKQWHPLGEVAERQQLIFVGYDLDFKTGKTDEQIANFFSYIDQQLLAGQPAPRVRVVETIKHFDGNDEIWIYPDALVYGYQSDTSSAEDEIKESFKGSCSTRIPG